MVNIIEKLVKNIKSSETLNELTNERIAKIFKNGFFLKIYANTFLGEEHKIS